MASPLNTRKSLHPEEMIERTKQVLFLKGRHTSEIVKTAMKDLTLLSKPHCKNLNRNNDILPFEDVNSIEFLGSKNDCGLFVLGSHTKKRPNNLIIGRLYEQHILDMYEFGINRYQSIEDFPGNKKAFGAKPLMVFLGDGWQNDVLYSKMQNLFIDLFRGFKADKLCLTGIDHVISLTLYEGNIYIRTFYVNYAPSGSNVPQLSLKPMGPFFDLVVRRTQTAADDMWKIACRKPKNLTAPKVKNIEKSIKGDKLGRIHMKKQNLDSMGGRRMDALRKNKRSREENDGSSNKKSKI